MHTANEFMGGGGTSFHACHAGRASIGKELEFKGFSSAFGIVAPETPERTTLQEDGGPDTRAVVYGESLDIEDSTGSAHGVVATHSLSYVLIDEVWYRQNGVLPENQCHNST